MESIIGPVSGGYHVAAYANSLEGDTQGYLGYYKICLTAPLSYWEAEGCVLKGCTVDSYEDSSEALREALAAGATRAGMMPSTADYAQWLWERLAEATRRYGGYVAG